MPTGGAKSRQQIADALEPLVGSTTELFGAERLVFGSNFPIDKSIADRDGDTFRDHARRVYRI